MKTKNQKAKLIESESSEFSTIKRRAAIREKGLERSARTRATLLALVEEAPLQASAEANELCMIACEILLKVADLSESQCKELAIEDYQPELYVNEGAAAKFSWRIEEMVKQLCTLVRSRRFSLGDHAWRAATDLVEAIHDLAMTAPEDLRSIARKSLTMPSLRAKPARFTHDFKQIAKAIQLSEDTAIDMDSKARHSLDSHATHLVATFIERAAFLRKIATVEEGRLRLFHLHYGNLGKDVLKMDLEQFLSVAYPKDTVVELMLFKDLPQLDKLNVDIWWEKALKPHLEEEETLKQIQETPFYAMLEKASAKSKKTSKEYAIRDELKKRCRQALRSLAGPKSATPHTFHFSADEYRRQYELQWPPDRLSKPAYLTVYEHVQHGT